MAIDLEIKSIVDSDLDMTVLKSYVFERFMRHESSFFHSKKVNSAMRAYVENDFIRDKAQVLWKELLIDAICLLKINDSREASFSLGAQGDEAKFANDFEKIRNVSSFGIDELEAYFGDFAQFESVLYNEKYYRDHIHHVISVWAVGIGLLFCSAEEKRVKPTLPDGMFFSKKLFRSDDLKGEAKHNELSRTELWAMWTIIALCHDLGYPLEKASKINQKVKKIVNHFGCFNFDELNFRFDILNTFLIDKFLKVISSKPVSSTKLQCSKNSGEADKANVADEHGSAEHKEEYAYHTEVQQKYLDKFSKSLEEYRHGMFSGLLLFKKLVYFLETDFAPRSRTISVEDRRQFIIRREILRSICCHTCPKIYHIELSTLSFLLILCDEIQEWNRPRFEDFINNKKECQPVTRISKFDVSPDGTAIVVRMDYKSTEKVTYEAVEALVLKKFQNFIYLLRSAKDDDLRKIEFEWITTLGKIEFSFKFSQKVSSECPFSVEMKSKTVRGKPCVLDVYDNECKEIVREYINKVYKK